MIPLGNVLVVDDEKAWFETYKDVLVPEGYTVEWAMDQESALERVRNSPWDVVVLDQRLRGAEGGNIGIDLVAEIVPSGAKVIIATGYADPATIERAFRDGAYDYLEKTLTLSTLLRIKVRNATEAVRERRLATLGIEEREKEIRDLWSAVQSEPNRNRKGLLLENLMVLLFRSVPGFQNANPRKRSRDEEIDIIIRNESTDLLWSRENSQYILVECKNWSKPIGGDEIVLFRNKMENRGGRCRLGFFVAMRGFTNGFHTLGATFRKDDILVVPMDKADLDELVNAKDRNAVLKRFHERAVLAGNGHNGH